jgi:starch synthase
MFVVMIASECAPVAKVGGLGDVVYGLARELEIRGNAVEIILPKYDCLRYEHVWNLHPVFEDLWVPWGGGQVHCTVWFGFVHGRKCFFIDPHSDELFFNRGTFYGCHDEHIRFAFFSRAALEFLCRSGKRPDVIHTHDWQTGLVAPLLFELYQSRGLTDQRVCHTIHNFKHQGAAGPEILVASGLGRPDHFLSPERMGDDWHAGVVNFTKAAIVFANFVTTVSPRHAWEARHTDQGFGLGHALHRIEHKFGGILNGLDYEVWNPETDPHVPVHFTVDSFERKALATRALRERLWLRESDGPIVAYVGRLDPQKGLHLIKHALDYALGNGAQFVLLGSSPEAGIDADFRQLRAFLNDNPDCHLELGFDEGLAHLIYAGADLVVVPSLFEPCGLPQMIALRYGTVPVVRGVGGLRDTVFDRDWSDVPEYERNGFVFDHADFPGIESALDRAFALWRDDREAFRQLACTGMRYDYSWNEPGQHYLNVYEFIRHR